MEPLRTTEERSWKSRSCLSLWEYPRSWSLTKTPNTRTLIRRIFMWIILLLRTLQTIIILVYLPFATRATSIAFGLVFGIVSLLFIFWCLTMIDRAQGQRRVCGLVISRLHLDIFVASFAIINLIMVVGFWTFLGYLYYNISWFALWAFIGFYGFVSTIAPDYA